MMQIWGVSKIARNVGVSCQMAQAAVWSKSTILRASQKALKKAIKTWVK